MVILSAFKGKYIKYIFLLGGSNTKEGIKAMNHAPNFRVEEESIRVDIFLNVGLQINNDGNTWKLFVFQIHFKKKLKGKKETKDF